MNFNLRAILLLTLAFIALAAPAGYKAKATTISPVAAAALQPNIGVKAYSAMEKAQRGRTVQAAVVLEIPNGYHINSNRPTGKYLVPTSLKVEVGDGVKVGGISYPRALIRTFSFSEEKLSVYEGRAVLRFNLSVPQSFPHSKMQVKARVKYQSCSNNECYPPVTRDADLWIEIAGDKDTVKRANAHIFGKQG